VQGKPLIWQTWCWKGDRLLYRMQSVGFYCHNLNAVNELLNTEVLLYKLRNYTARLMISVRCACVCVEYHATSDLSVILSASVTVHLLSAVEEAAVTYTRCFAKPATLAIMSQLTLGFLHCRRFVSSQTTQFCRCVYELF
jgi:hypothetical protein